MKLIQSGPRTAKLVIVGDALGQIELSRGIPFSGGSGDILNELLEASGLVRSEVFVTNVTHHRPPNNEFDWFFGKTAFTEHYVPGVEQLQADLSEIRPNLILALGKEALRALTGKDAISSWRGSILPCKLVPGLKVLASYHPAVALRIYDFKSIMRFDFGKIEREISNVEIHRPLRDFYLDPNPHQRMTLISEMLSAEWLSIDIECTQLPNDDWKLSCVGFSDERGRAMTIPMRHTEDYRDVKVLCESNVKKVLQNGQFDATVLRDNGIAITNFAWDTMVAHQLLFMESASGGEEIATQQGKKKFQAFMKGLAFQTSIYTEEPFYKEDGKLWRVTGDLQMFWRYNAMDAAVTREIRDVQEEYLNEVGMLPLLYESMRQHHHLMHAMWRGIKIDNETRLLLAAEARDKVNVLQAQLNELAGWEVNVKSPDVGKLLFTQLKMRARKFSIKTQKASADADTLAALAISSPHPALRLILDIREQRQLIESFLETPLSRDGRLRCLFDLTGTRTGRLASRDALAS